MQIELVFKDGKAINLAACDELVKYLTFFGGTLDDVVEASRLSSIELADSFKNHRGLVGEHHEMQPEFYAKKGYLDLEDCQRRLAYVRHLNAKVDQFEGLQERGQATVVPVVQGRSENAAWRIGMTGFGYSPTLDPGYYGKGLGLLF